jgi:glycine cleavage system T protein
MTARAGAEFAEDAGWLMPARFERIEGEYQSARGRAAVFDVSHHAKVEVTGADAVTFLQNLSTNDVAKLPVGAGCEIFLTNAQARVMAHAVVYRLLLPDGREGLWLDAVPGLAEKIIKHLDHYLISEQVELADHTRQLAQIHLAGPQAPQVLEKALHGEVLGLEELQHTMRAFGADATCHVCRHSPLGVPGYDIVCANNQAPAVWQMLIQAGAAPAGFEAYELLRVEAGTPVYGKDMDESNLALEVGRTQQAICYTKGCFLGQEPLVRIRDLGHINRLLLGLNVEGGEPVPRGVKLLQGGKEVGQVTSSVVSPAMGSVIALAYVRRGWQEPGTALEVEAAGGRWPASVVALPFISSGPGTD